MAPPAFAGEIVGHSQSLPGTVWVMSREGLCEALAVLLALVDSGDDGQNEFPSTEMAHLSEGAPAVTGVWLPSSDMWLFLLCPFACCPLSHSQPSHGMCGLSLDVELN